MFNDKRIIGRYGGKVEGPLVLGIGAVHGNEPAGVKALEEVFKMLEMEQKTNPGFIFKGCIYGLTGNVAAYKTGARYINKDLNRIWHPENVDKLLSVGPESLQHEEKELVELLTVIRQIITETQSRHIIIIDLHTTSADGGIFSIPLEDDADSIRLAEALHAPVVMGLLKGLNGTLMHYASGNHFIYNGLPETAGCVAFEAGQHDDPLSVSRCISAVISTLRAVGCVKPEDVDHKHDDILLDYASGLPKRTRITHVHHIGPEEHFSMRPGYLNFQPVKRGEQLAVSVKGPILAPSDGLILMPLYQPKGTDGFFIVEPV